MPITEILQKNADFYPQDVSLVEINPKNENNRRLTWQEYSLIEIFLRISKWQVQSLPFKIPESLQSLQEYCGSK